MLREISNHFIAAGELALDVVLDRQSGLLAVEFENLVHRMEEFFGLAGRDFDFWLLLFGRLSLIWRGNRFRWFLRRWGLSRGLVLRILCATGGKPDRRYQHN